MLGAPNLLGEEAALEFWDTIEAKTSSVFGAGPGTWLELCFLNERTVDG